MRDEGVCRTCLQIFENDKLTSINQSKDSDKISLKEKLLTCVPEVTVDIVNDPVACSDCCAAITLAYQLKSTCIESEKILYKYIKHRQQQDLYDLLSTSDLIRLVRKDYTMEEHSYSSFQNFEPKDYPICFDNETSADEEESLRIPAIIQSSLDAVVKQALDGRTRPVIPTASATTTKSPRTKSRRTKVAKTKVKTKAERKQIKYEPSESLYDLGPLENDVLEINKSINKIQKEDLRKKRKSESNHKATTGSSKKMKVKDDRQSANIAEKAPFSTCNISSVSENVEKYKVLKTLEDEANKHIEEDNIIKGVGRRTIRNALKASKRRKINILENSTPVKNEQSDISNHTNNQIENDGTLILNSISSIVGESVDANDTLLKDSSKTVKGGSKNVSFAEEVNNESFKSKDSDKANKSTSTSKTSSPNKNEKRTSRSFSEERINTSQRTRSPRRKTKSAERVSAADRKVRSRTSTPDKTKRTHEVSNVTENDKEGSNIPTNDAKTAPEASSTSLSRSEKLKKIAQEVSDILGNERLKRKLGKELKSSRRTSSPKKQEKTRDKASPSPNKSRKSAVNQDEDELKSDSNASKDVKDKMQTDKSHTNASKDVKDKMKTEKSLTAQVKALSSFKIKPLKKVVPEKIKVEYINPDMIENYEAFNEESSLSDIKREPKRYRCTKCNKGYNFKSHFDVHLKSHIFKKLFSCPVCGKDFSQQKYLQAHALLHTPKSGTYQCHICLRYLSASTALKRHYRTHTGEKPFACLICEKHFTQKIQLDVHMRTHTGDKPFKCDTCKSEFAQKSHLMGHVRIHTGEKPYKCDRCPKSFRKSYALRIHEHSHSKKPFQCNACNFLFKDAGVFERHVNKHLASMATGSHVLKKKTSTDKEIDELEQDVNDINMGISLSDQINANTKEEFDPEFDPFCCKICGKQFTTKFSMKRHMRLMHTA